LNVEPTIIVPSGVTASASQNPSVGVSVSIPSAVHTVGCHVPSKRSAQPTITDPSAFASFARLLPPLLPKSATLPPEDHSLAWAEPPGWPGRQ
jgi:hypothetical protein